MIISEIRKLPDSKWHDLFSDPYWSLNGVIRQLECHSSKLYFDEILQAAQRLGYNRIVGNKKPAYSEQHVREAVQNSICWTDVLKNLGLSPQGGNETTIKRYVKKYNISIEHFDIKIALARNNKTIGVNRLCKTDQPVHRSQIRALVIKEKLLPYVCNECDSPPVWRDKPLTLELDHIDGDTSNNIITNLRFLCPNCHDQTLTYGRRKRK